MFARLLTDTAAAYPDETALVYGEQRWTWSELKQAVEKLTRGLAQVGIKPDQDVAIWLSNTPCFVISYLAVLARGAVVVPLNPAMKRGDCDRLRELRAVITSRKLETPCRTALGAADEKVAPEFLVCPDADRWDGWDLIGKGSLRAVVRLPTDRAMLQYSSGSTGRPKPLYRTHQQCLAEVQHFQTTCGISAADKIFCALPLFHAHGLANAMWAAVGSGATLLLMKNPQPFPVQWERAVAILETDRATVFPGVPFMFQTLSDAPRNANLSSLRLCFSAGSALPREVFEHFLAKFDVPIRQLYGCTEAGSVTINLDPDPSSCAGTVGRPMEGIEIDVVDENGDSLVHGKTGEIVFRSPAATMEYADEEALNQLCFKDGWFCTGDMGMFDDAGRLVIMGRKTFVITVAGHKVYANEVEDMLARHAKVAEAAVIGIPDERFGEVIKAYVVLQEPMTAGELMAYTEAELPEFKRPQLLQFVDALPKTPLGKVAKSQLP